MILREEQMLWIRNYESSKLLIATFKHPQPHPIDLHATDIYITYLFRSLDFELTGRMNQYLGE